MRKALFIMSLLAFSLIVFEGCAKLTEDEYNTKAMEAYSQGKLEDALKLYKEVISKFPESPKLPDYKNQLTEVIIRMAETTPASIEKIYLPELAKAGVATDTNTAWLKFKAATADSANRTETLKKLDFKDFLLAAQYAVNRVRYQDAIAVYELALEAHPDDTAAYKPAFLAGFIASEDVKDFEKAKKFYTIVVEKFPTCELADDAQWMLENMNKPPDQIKFKTDDAKTKSKPLS